MNTPIITDTGEEHMEVDEIEDREGVIRIDDIIIPPPPLPACTSDSSGPRVIISRIENINFKSYAGKQVLGPFHKNFTSIVGPNGSGKSNVIDSMLFVFGYRAQKIRCKKIGILIHNSDLHKNIEKCSVSVVFQKIVDKSADEYEVVPDSEFVISRTAFKDNTSYYSINNRRVQFKDVASMLRIHNVDLDHNRFLILQGEVEQIAMMKPKGQGEHDVGLLEYLEDIVGCSRFKEPLLELATRIENLNEQRVEKLNRVKTVEKEKDEIEGAKNDALEYVKMKNEIALKNNSLYQVHRNVAQTQLKEMQKDKEEIMEEMKGFLDRLKKLEESRAVKEKEYDKIQQNYEKCSKTIEELNEQYSELERQDVEYREKRKHCKAKEKKLTKNLEIEEQSLENLRCQPEVCEKEINKLEKEKVKLEVEKKVAEENLVKVMASLKQETQGYQEEKDRYEAQLIELKKVVNETKSAMDIAQSELDIYVSNEKNEQSKLFDATKSLEKIITKKMEVDRNIKDVNIRIPQATEKLERCKKKLSDIQREEDRLTSEIKNKRQKVEEDRSALRASSNRGKVLESLMQQKSSGDLPGILGRLGDLGAIEEKYDVAISTACGALDNMVADTMSTAQKSVEFLKKNSIGYTTFIALDKMEKWVPYTKQKIVIPENVPRLFDLIKVKEKRVLPAFYFTLRDTLVADNLEQATRIGLQGKKRYRVVTLRGELIDFSGTMSGGGGKVSRGRMGQSIVTNDITQNHIDRNEKQLNELTKTLLDVKEMRSSIEDSIVETLKEKSILEHSLQKFLLDYQAHQELENTLKIQIEELKKKVVSAAPDEAKVRTLQNKVDNDKREYAKAFEAASKIEKKVQKVHSLIMEITEGKVFAAQQKLDTLNNKIDGISSLMTKAEVAVKTANRNIKKCNDKVKSLKKEIEENQQLVEDLGKEFNHLDEKAIKIKADSNAADEEKGACEKQKKEILHDISTIKQEENRLNRTTVDIRNKFDICTNKIKDIQSSVTHWDSRISELKVQAIDDEPPFTLFVLSPKDIEDIDVDAVQYEIAVMEEKVKHMKPNMAAIAEFRKKEAQYLERVTELDRITTQRDVQRKHHDDLRKRRLAEFMKGFNIITAKLKELYQMITLGGDAELELVDSLDPFSEGVVFSVRPPKKSWKNISNLSGGEKTLSSLALVFALHYYKPTPFYVMDEIDAALDFKNVSIVGNYIKERTKNAQFIIISLRNNMFELCDFLVGIYKTHDCTKTIPFNPKKIAGIIEDDTNDTRK